MSLTPKERSKKIEEQNKLLYEELEAFVNDPEVTLDQSYKLEEIIKKHADIVNKIKGEVR